MAAPSAAWEPSMGANVDWLTTRSWIPEKYNWFFTAYFISSFPKVEELISSFRTAAAVVPSSILLRPETPSVLILVYRA